MPFHGMVSLITAILNIIEHYRTLHYGWTLSNSMELHYG